MLLMRAERFFSTEPSHGWFGVTEYVHGHRDSDSLQAVARHWLLGESSRLFTGTEDEPDRHGPFTSSADLWRRFRETSPADVVVALRAWGADADRFAGTSIVADEVERWATALMSPSRSAACLLLVPSDEELAAQSSEGHLVGVCVGFAQALWIRPEDARLVVVTCSDD